MEKVSARADTQKRLPRFRRVEDVGHFEIVDDDIELLSAIGRYRVVQSIHLDALFPIAVAKSYGGGCNYTFTPV